MDAALQLIKEKGAKIVTVDGVAKQARCAKGLIHYHFKTKAGLLSAVAHGLATTRQENWSHAFDALSPKDAIDQTWALLCRESETGEFRAWSSLFQSSLLPDATVREAGEGFSHTLGGATRKLMQQIDLIPTVPAAEIGWLLGALVHGMGFQLSSQGTGDDLEGAYAAGWLGILSLFVAKPG